MFNWKTLSGGAAVSIMALAATPVADAQVTTSSLRGVVSNDTGAPVSDATVTILHVPTGSVSTATTNAQGSYAARGLRPGGPYTITATGSSIPTIEAESVFLTLDQTQVVDLSIDEAAHTLEAIVVTASASALTPVATGPSSSFGLEDLQNLPAVNRDLRDVIRVDPRVYIDESFADGVQCAGANPRYNSLTVDGIGLNDGFGLNSNGFPTQRQPFSFDAIDQVAVELAPFDVQYGNFTACNINAVTKSGTNEFRGGVFYDYTDATLQGSSLEDDQFDVPSFTEKRYGGTLGGPIIKDKLFFFAAYEKFEGSDVFQNGPEGSGVAEPVEGFTQAEFDTIRQAAIDLYDYDPGGIPSDAAVEDEKILLRLDWNINSDHRASLTYNYNEGNNVFASDDDSNEFEFSNHLYEKATELEAYSGQFFSDWSNNFSTEFRVAYNKVDTSQISNDGAVFGEFQIRDSGNTYYLGSDDSRHANALSYEVLTLKGVANYQFGNHALSFGAERLSYDIFNLFVQEAEGEYRFSSIDDFVAGIPSRITYENAPTNNAEDAAAEFKYAINTLYAQDDWEVMPGLVLTGGLRYDFYTFDDEPPANANFLARNGFSNTETLDGEGLIQPRFAVNWEATDRLSVRGGFGLYAGGNPNVWVSNSYSNTGVASVELQDRSGTNLFDLTYVNGEDGRNTAGYGIPEDLFNGVASGSANSGVNAIDPDFEIPSEYKVAIGATYDLMIPGLGDGYVLNTDLLYSETNNAAIISDATLEQIGTAPDGRPLYQSIDRSDPDCADPTSEDCSSRNFNQDFILTNTDGGSQTVFSISLAKEFENGVDFSLAYAYVDSEDVSPMTSSVAFSNYANIAVSDPENPGVATTNYEIPQRITATLGWKKAFVGDYYTKFNLFGQANEGRPYSFVFADDDGDIFGDRIDRRHLLYVPTGIDDPLVVFGPDFDTEAFFAYVDDQGLSRGAIQGRNDQSGSWWIKADLRIEQELPGFRKNDRSAVFMVVENFTNLLNDEWGILRQASFPQARAIVDADYDADANQYIYEEFFDLNAESRVSTASSWEIRFGVKYDF